MGDDGGVGRAASGGGQRKTKCKLCFARCCENEGDDPEGCICHNFTLDIPQKAATPKENKNAAVYAWNCRVAVAKGETLKESMKFSHKYCSAAKCKELVKGKQSPKMPPGKGVGLPMVATDQDEKGPVGLLDRGRRRALGRTRSGMPKYNGYAAMHPPWGVSPELARGWLE